MYYFTKNIAFKNMHSNILKINYTIMQFQSAISKILSSKEKEGTLIFTKSPKASPLMKLACKAIEVQRL
jgi:hypothetical protein